MEVQLTKDQQEFIRQAVQSGRLSREEDAVQEALSLWENRSGPVLLASIDLAEASLLTAQAREITDETMRELASDVKVRGRARLAAEPQAK